MRSFRDNYKRFIETSEKFGKQSSVQLYFVYLVYRVRYKSGIREFFEDRLYDKNIDHSQYFANIHSTTHSWKVVQPDFMPDASCTWRFFHKIDFVISKLLYPGLDAMDYFRYEFYKLRHCARKEFITEGELSKLDRYFNDNEKARAAKIIENKALFNQMFPDIVTRKWLCSKGATYEVFCEFCKNLQSVIVKPLDRACGQGIFLAQTDTEEAKHQLFTKVKDKNYILEEIVKQHPDIATLNPSSVNTIRINSVFANGKPHITGATLRIGNGPKPVDNYSSGGLAAEIDLETGYVISRAVSQKGSSVYVHPFTGKPIIGVCIPRWNDVKKCVLEAHKRVPQLGYLGWDVVVCEDNSITFLEVNTGAGVALQQHPSRTGKKPIYRKYCPSI